MGLTDEECEEFKQNKKLLTNYQKLVLRALSILIINLITPQWLGHPQELLDDTIRALAKGD